jgi:signal transduction histidine kinase
MSRRLRVLDETLVKTAYDGILVIDGDCRILERSKMSDRGDLVGEGDLAVSGKDLFAVVPELGEGLRRQLMAVIASGERANLNIERERDGQTAYFEVTVAPGTGRTSLGIRNVTETRALENRLIQTEKLARSGQMAAEIGHDLRNFLTVLMGHADLLVANPAVAADERAARSAGVVADQLQRIERFASGLMDLGVLRMAREPSDLNDLIRRLIAFIQGQARFQRVTFAMDLYDSLPPVSADPGQVQQVFLNLYANAADAMTSGTVTTTTRLRAAAGEVDVVVRDEGPGMTPEVLRRVFDSGFTTKKEGHGHGLAICRRIVENHNGTIRADSEPGRGTTFTLVFKV